MLRDSVYLHPDDLYEQTSVTFGLDGDVWGGFVYENDGGDWEGLVGRLARSSANRHGR